MKKIKIYWQMLGMIFIPSLLMAQTEPQDVAAVDNKFQNIFMNL